MRSNPERPVGKTCTPETGPTVARMAARTRLVTLLSSGSSHVLSSGVAGTMAANRSGLQRGTILNMVMAWVLTLPAAIMLSAALFFIFRHTF